MSTFVIIVSRCGTSTSFADTKKTLAHNTPICINEFIAVIGIRYSEVESRQDSKLNWGAFDATEPKFNLAIQGDSTLESWLEDDRDMTHELKMLIKQKDFKKIHKINLDLHTIAKQKRWDELDSLMMNYPHFKNQLFLYYSPEVEAELLALYSKHLNGDLRVVGYAIDSNTSFSFVKRLLELIPDVSQQFIIPGTNTKTSLLESSITSKNWEATQYLLEFGYFDDEIKKRLIKLIDNSQEHLIKSKGIVVDLLLKNDVFTKEQLQDQLVKFEKKQSDLKKVEMELDTLTSKWPHLVLTKSDKCNDQKSYLDHQVYQLVEENINATETKFVESMSSSLTLIDLSVAVELFRIKKHKKFSSIRLAEANKKVILDVFKALQEKNWLAIERAYQASDTDLMKRNIISNVVFNTGVYDELDQLLFEHAKNFNILILDLAFTNRVNKLDLLKSKGISLDFLDEHGKGLYYNLVNGLKASNETLDKYKKYKNNDRFGVSSASLFAGRSHVSIDKDQVSKN